MKAEILILNHAERDARDEAYMASLRALPRFIGGFSQEALREQVRIGDLMRRNLERFYPHMIASFASLPDLNKSVAPLTCACHNMI